MTTKKGVIGILTGGGDVPGLNPAIRAVTIRALREGCQVIGGDWTYLYVNEACASMAMPAWFMSPSSSVWVLNSPPRARCAQTP